MKKLVLSLGKVLSKTEQRSISGGRRCGTNDDCWGSRICTSIGGGGERRCRPHPSN